MSCKKAQQVFEQHHIEIEETTDARKEKIDNDKAWSRLSGASMVHIGKGKKTLVLEPTEQNREEILKSAMGRSGNLRAPTVKKGNTMYIGFNETMYEGFAS